MYFASRKKQLLAEEKVKNSGSINVEDAKAYGNEPASRAVLSYTTLEQGFQAHMVTYMILYGHFSQSYW